MRNGRQIQKGRFLGRVYSISLFSVVANLVYKKRKENTSCRCATNKDLWLCGKTWEELQKNQLFLLLRRALCWFFSKIESEGESERPLRIMVLSRTSNDFYEAFCWLMLFIFSNFCEGEWIMRARAATSMTRIELRARAADKWQF